MMRKLRFTEGIMARGDRKISKAIEEAYRLGCLFDSWTKFPQWTLDAGIWEHGCWYWFLQSAWAWRRWIVPVGFHRYRCDKKVPAQRMGSCDGRKSNSELPYAVFRMWRGEIRRVSVMKARIKFRKYGSLRFIGHLDVMRFFQKVMRRIFRLHFQEDTGRIWSCHLLTRLESDWQVTENILYWINRSSQQCRCSQKDERAQLRLRNRDRGIRRIAEERKVTGVTILAGTDYLTSVREHFRRAGKERFSEFMEQARSGS